MSSKCLICARQTEGDGAYHTSCLKNLFEMDELPELPYSTDELEALAKKAVKSRITVPGVQAKLSLEIERKAEKASKLTIEGLWGRFILKPPSAKWPQLPKNEHCTLMMAEGAGIETVPHGLIRLKSGDLAFITRRIDRGPKGEKFAMEDMCQLSRRMTEDKYKGSHEQIAKVIKEHTANPILDVMRFFELVLFCYVTGNGDMHLKNFSLVNDARLGWKLSAAYDLLCTRLVIPKEKDPDELALTLQGKKSNFTKNTFEEFGDNIGLNIKQIANVFGKYRENATLFKSIIDRSFLGTEMKEEYKKLVKNRFATLFD